MIEEVEGGAAKGQVPAGLLQSGFLECVLPALQTGRAVPGGDAAPSALWGSQYVTQRNAKRGLRQPWHFVVKLIDFISYSGFRFTEKLCRKYREFPNTPSPPATHFTSPVNTLHGWDSSVTTDKPTLIN